MKYVNIKIPIIIFVGIFLLATTILFPVNGVAESKLFTTTDELSCSDVKVQVITTCTEDTRQDWPSGLCTDQHFLFKDKRTGKTNTVKGLNEYIDNQVNADTQSKRTNKWLSGVAYSWACVKGRERSYIIIMYSTGGNCEVCEWAAIYNLEGKMLVSDQGKPIEKGIKHFRTVYKKIGLPVKWPRSSFLHIKQLKKED